MASERASESGRGDSVPPLQNITCDESIFENLSEMQQIQKWRKFRRGRPDSPAGTEPFLTGVSGGRVLSISSGVTAGPKLTCKYLSERCEQN